MVITRLAVKPACGSPTSESDESESVSPSQGACVDVEAGCFFTVALTNKPLPGSENWSDVSSYPPLSSKNHPVCTLQKEALID